MVWLKSAFVGVAAVLVFAVLAAVIYPIILNRNSGTQGLIGVDWVLLLKTSPIVRGLLALAFAAGFAWQYRRLMH